MKPERHEQTDKIFKIFQSAIEMGQEQRARFLESACADDAELRREVEALLAYDEKAEGFIESPAIEEAAALMEDDKIQTLVGEAIGPFKIISRLGSGGMGEVYLAEDSRLGRKVALKLLDRSLIGDSQSRTRFLREARLASALDHPNICTIHEIGESAGLLFIAMQYVEGKTLKQMIAGRPLSLDSLLSISLQVAGGLAAAHAQGIIHRDIKSNNIIITPRGQVKVLDFGLARPTKKEGQQPELTRTGAVMGTPAYMSPEQARGERVDHRSDIFSVGVVMYEMATGRTPFKGKSQAETMNAVINQPHRPIEEIKKDLPLEACMVIDRALAKQPSDRHQSMEEMTGDLRRVAQAIGLVGSHSSDPFMVPFMVPYVAPKQSWAGWSKQRLGGTARGAALSAGLGALLVGLALLVYYLWFSHAVATTEIKSIAVLPFKSLVAANRDEPLELGMADALISKLSGSGDVTVRPLSAIRKFSLVEQDTVAAGRELGVDSVLDGSIQTSGDRFRVSAKLLRTSDGKQLWAEQFDEKFTDIFSLQDSISQRVASALKTRLGSSEKKHSTENVEAYQLYMKGRYHLAKQTPRDILASILYFQQAIDIDPEYALAYTGLSQAYGVLAIGGFMTAAEAAPKAKAAGQKAIEIDDTLGEAHNSLCMGIFWHDWDWDAAEKECRKAIEINPNDGDSHGYYAIILSNTGRHAEALAEVKRARELNPLDLSINALEGQYLLHAGRADEALIQLRKTSELEPNFPMAHLFSASAYIEKGMFAEAIAESRKEYELSGRNDIPFGTYALAKSGRRDEARAALRELVQLSATKYVSPYSIALIYNALDERENAFDWLERGVELRDPKMTFLKVEPKWNNLRDDPRFQALLRRVGFAP